MQKDDVRDEVEAKLLLDLGKRLKQLRVKSKMSQNDLSNACNLHITYISSIERGGRNVSFLNIVKLAKALRCDPETLFR